MKGEGVSGDRENSFNYCGSDRTWFDRNAGEMDFRSISYTSKWELEKINGHKKALVSSNSY